MTLVEFLLTMGASIALLSSVTLMILTVVKQEQAAHAEFRRASVTSVTLQIFRETVMTAQLLEITSPTSIVVYRTMPTVLPEGESGPIAGDHFYFDPPSRALYSKPEGKNPFVLAHSVTAVEFAVERMGSEGPKSVRLTLTQQIDDDGEPITRTMIATARNVP